MTYQQQQRQRRQRPGPESEAERRIWDAVMTLRPPELEGLVAQHKVLRYRLDMAIPHLGVGIEIDGYEYHSDKDTFVDDRRRQRHLESEGWRIIRFAGREAIYDPEQCVRQMALLVAQIREEREQRQEQLSDFARESWFRQVYNVEYTELTEACEVFRIDLTRLHNILECEHDFTIIGAYSDETWAYTPCFGCGVEHEFLERIGWDTGTVRCLFCSPFEPNVPCVECGRGFE